MITLSNNKRALYLLLFLTSLAGSIILASGKSQKEQAFPIKIKVKEKPPKSVKVEEYYVLHIDWENKDKINSYNGKFVLNVTLKNDNIVNSDLEVKYKEHIIEAVEANGYLEFWLPSQEFHSLESDYIEVLTSYFSSGEYLWTIAISKE